jgi:site-specific DNA recombinase
MGPLRQLEDSHTAAESDRPQFMEMLAAMMGNGVKTVIVESLDRFARDLLVQSALLSKLAAEGLVLIAANTGEDVTAAMQNDPMRKAMVQIQSVFAELDKTLLVRKLKRGRDAKREASGRCEGRKPFGHYDGERESLDRIRQLRRKPRNGDRLSFGAVATALNNAAIRSRSGKPWTRATVQKLCAANRWV